ncbi:MAG TPA: AAA family ATPase [Steroidobacteraceae bacterium]|nr:AAA family ATPase [Steroidobacteraceae bacterium]
MYEKFFGLSQLPFTLTPDPAFLYQSPQHKFAMTLLRYGLVSRAGFCLLTGEVGSGKTLLVRHLLSSVEQELTVGLVASTSRRMDRLLPWVCVAFGLETRGLEDADLFAMFTDFVVREYAAGHRLLLIVDEAQNLGADMLEELRVISNINADRHLVLQTILVGQPELREMLQRRELRQFAQRISVDYHLDALTPADAQAYVKHRLAVAGGYPETILSEAVAIAHEASTGIPRLINQLCDTALVYAFADGITSVHAELMRHVVADRRKGGLFATGGPRPPVAAAMHS